MARREIRLEGDEVLRKKSRVVTAFDENLFILLDDMIETMYHNNGVGLAAPQVGVLKRVIVVDVGEDLVELVNPEIIETCGETINPEGCLSIPGECSYVKRPIYVKVKGFDRNGNEVIHEGEAFKAIAFCHEIDHLDGILYIDNALEGYTPPVVE